MKQLIFLLGLILACAACSNPKNKFEDKELLKIADLQDRRSTDSLVVYLTSDNVEYQRTAVLALGSVQDSSAGRVLAEPSKDTKVEVNRAFALGQMGISRAEGPLAFMIYGTDPVELHEVYEGLGKVVRKKSLAAFDTSVSDTIVLGGVAWGIFRAGLRGVTDSITISHAAAILSNKAYLLSGKLSGRDARLGAASFFSRSAFKPQPGVAAALISGASDGDPEIRMAAVNALAKLKPEETIAALANAITDTDYRVRVNAARALRTQPWEISKKYYEQLLVDSNAHVTIAVAEIISPVAPAADSLLVLDWARKAKNWQTQATLYEVFLKASPTSVVNQEVKDIYSKSDNPYQQAALLMALTNNWQNSGFMLDQFKATDKKLIKSTATNALARTNRLKTFPAAIEVTRDYAKMWDYIIADGDQGAILYACEALGDSALRYKRVITDYSFLEKAKAKLSLPKDYETYVPLERTLNYFKNLPPPPPLKNEYNHPIDWNLAVTIGKNQKVEIETTKGKIVMQLFIEEAPGSVVNFVKLVNDKYYDGKYFHRVVPNFVIQTGCDRGDGFGSLDYSIRSEFSRRKYKTGSVGMASAGKDTEGTQWFITHSPTPHLDGKYTIFAEVVSGMEVVHQIEVGDQIISARLVVR
jgi:cyclophilin family peptidyl-prolyl cis-trans isomerase/HEAT repeat protein